MSADNGQPEPEPIGEPGVLNIPLVSLAGCGLRIDKFPDGNQMLVLGPVALAIPLGPPVVEWLEQNLKGSPIIVAPASAMPKSPPGQ